MKIISFRTEHRPEMYYHNKRGGLDLFYYRADKPMSMVTEDSANHAIQHYTLYDGHNEEYSIEDARPGMIYRSYSRPDTLGYVTDNDPFEATVQMVGVQNKYLIVQEIDYDEEKHHGHVPHHRVYPNDFYEMAKRLQFDSGRFSGIFQYSRQGTRMSLRLA